MFNLIARMLGFSKSEKQYNLSGLPFSFSMVENVREKGLSRDEVSKKDLNICDRYFNAALEFGGVVYYLGACRKCIDFENMFEAWKQAEIDYARIGFMPLSIDYWVNCHWQGWKNTDSALYQPITADDKIICHAHIYETLHMKNAGLCVAQQAMQTGEVVVGNWEFPSTEDRRNQERYFEALDKQYSSESAPNS